MSFTEKLDKLGELKKVFPAFRPIDTDSRVDRQHRVNNYNAAAKNQTKREPIPEADLLIIEAIYYKRYKDSGRKRGALLRYIENYRKPEPKVDAAKFYRTLKRKK
jgi:hypothetical protein